MTHEIVFELRDINFCYTKGHNVLKNLNMKITHGKLIAIAGPNGSGKTTLIKHFNGLHKPQSGMILFKGKPVENHRHLTEHVGIVFQNPDEQIFFPSVEDDLAFGLRNFKVPEDEIKRRVDNVLKALKIEKLRYRSFFNLSFGEKKKIAFAGVMITSPDIMVIDEPTIGLDPWSKEDFLEMILEMKKHHTVIVVSHDYDLLKIVDEIHFLWEGEIKAVYEDFEEFKENMFKVVPE
ncbi:MAG: ABC transporter ATP-binding protein [Candidatus Heimdallarchaeota archaeon]|nr:ABC transporter ATP-binding protein [Candidatus Heimdallarchaeota archaeon]